MIPLNNQGTAILLGAGFSTRFGEDKRLLELQSKPLLSHTALLYRSVFSDTVLVLRDTDEALSKLVPEDIEIVYTDRAQYGISESIKAGLKVRLKSSWIVIGLIDMPFVESETLHLLRDQMMKSPQQIVRLRYRNRMGNPVGIPKQYYSSLLSLTGDQGARNYLAKWESNTLVLDVVDGGIHRDIDTSEDWFEYSDRS